MPNENLTPIRFQKWLIAITVITVVVFGLIMYRQFYQLKSNQAARAQAVELIVWTYSSFIDSYGPAQELKAEFEKTCDCTVVYVDAGGSPMAIEKMRLDPTRRVDVLMGIDLLQLAKLMNTVRVQDINPPQIDWEPEVKKYVYPRAVPYSWSPMGLIYRSNETQPVSSWAAAIEGLKDKSLSLQDPTLSSPGLEFLYWISSIAPLTELKSKLTAIKRLVHSYSPSWSSAYGLFRAKQSSAAFSYLTSLVYHWQNERDKTYQFMSFTDGHPVQIEYAAVPDSCWNCAVAKKYVEFLLTPFAQKILAEKNFMLPVNQGIKNQLSASFQELPQVKILGVESMEHFFKNEEAIMNIWREAH